MIERMALAIASSMKKAGEDQTPSIEVMKFSLITILHTLITVLFVFVVSLIVGKPLTTMYGMGYFMLLRFFSGGYHIHKSGVCTVLSVVLMCAAPFVELEDRLVFIANVVAVLMMLLFSPSNIRGFAQISEKYFPILKLVSVAIVGLNFLFHNPALAVLAIFQSILLLFKQKGGEAA